MNRTVKKGGWDAVSQPQDAGWPQIDPGELRSALGEFATGVTVVTAGGDTAHGMTANAFTSVSLDPPLVLVCVKNDARLNDCIAETGFFGVSILAQGQGEVARHFADSNRPPGDEQFERFDCHRGEVTGSPLVGASLAWFECCVAAVIPGGDHAIYLGRVLDFSATSAEKPLAFFEGMFTTLADAESK